MFIKKKKKKNVQTYRRFLTVSHGVNRILVVIIQQILKNLSQKRKTRVCVKGGKTILFHKTQ